METMINLNDLLKHEILDLYSVEEQIIEALPSMIEKARNPELKKALREHLKITEEQKSRLDKVKQTFGEGNGETNGENRGFFSRLFGSSSSGGEKCKGMEGIISEGQKILNADITEEALDSAIIASAQKIEHYEICGYGTARAFARELKLDEVERLLTQSLNEEYQADDNLTALAVGKLNIEAEQADAMDIGNNGKENGRPGSGSNRGSGAKNSSNKGSAAKGASASKSASKKAAASKSSSRSASKSGSKGSSKKGSAVSSKGSGSTKKAGSAKQASKGSGSSKKGVSASKSKSGGNKGGASKNSSSRSSAKSGSRKR